MQCLVPDNARNGARDFLRWCGRLDDQTELVRGSVLDRLERAHGPVLAVDPDREVVLPVCECIPVNLIDTRVDARVKARGPVVDLPHDEGVAHRADDDALVAHLLGAFELDRVDVGGIELAASNTDAARVDRVIGAGSQIERAGRFSKEVRVRVLVQAVGGDALRRAAQVRVGRLDLEVVVADECHHAIGRLAFDHGRGAAL